MRRRAGQLLPLEMDVLTIARELRVRDHGTGGQGDGWFHAYGIAELLSERHGTSLIDHGTLYRSLRKLADAGLLDRRVESDEEARAHAGRARRYYRLTEDGATRLAEASRPITVNTDALARRARPGLGHTQLLGPLGLVPGRRR